MGGAGAGAGAAKKKKKKPLHSSFSSSYVAGKVRMVASECETGVRAAKIPPKSAEDGWFVLWHMRPEKWYMELALGATTIKAGSNGKLVWRHTPWLGAHAAKGPVRPLRRALQVTQFASHPQPSSFKYIEYIYMYICIGSPWLWNSPHVVFGYIYIYIYTKRRRRGVLL